MPGVTAVVINSLYYFLFSQQTNKQTNKQTQPKLSVALNLDFYLGRYIWSNNIYQYQQMLQYNTDEITLQADK